MILEKDDAFEIDTGKLVVRSYRSDPYSFQLELESPDKTWTLRVAGSCSLKDDRGVEQGVEAAQLTGLVGKPVLSARARKSDGQLDLAIGPDRVLTVYPGDQYEPWEMYSTHGERLISVPGDGIAMWGPNP